MLFNSYEFIFVFLPISFSVYFYLNKKKLTIAAQIWLVFSSLFFYSWWNISYLPLILLSVFFNYYIASKIINYQIQNKNYLSKKNILIVGLIFNIGLLAYFKYMDFFIQSSNAVFHSTFDLLDIALPLAISFFTLQQIMYLVDAYKGLVREKKLLNYIVFVTFFPQLIAGPIVHHREMIPQFSKTRNKVKNYTNIAMGLFIFSIGLFKKVVIADTFAVWSTTGFDIATTLNFFEAWLVSISYTFQLYFDFSGYTDMAIGAALLFNIRLPANFNSPYKAKNIQDFWRRWHITLSKFLKDYVYIPLGGNRLGRFRTYNNLMMTFIIGGIWHGAGWTFVFWGFLHGLALVIHRFWNSLGLRMWSWLGWLITFNFVNITWIFFRATEWEDAIKVLKGMAGFNGVVLPNPLSGALDFLSAYGVKFGGWIINIDHDGGVNLISWVIIGFVLALSCPNSNEWLNKFKFNIRFFIFILIIFLVALWNMNEFSEFLYFKF